MAAAATPGHPGADPADCARSIAEHTPPAPWLGWSLGEPRRAAARWRGLTVRGLVAIASSPRFILAPDWPHAVDPSVFSGFANELETASNTRSTASSPSRRSALRTGARSCAPCAHRCSPPVRRASRPCARASPCSPARTCAAPCRDCACRACGSAAGATGSCRPPHWPGVPRRRPTHVISLPSGHAPFLAHAREIAEAIAALDAGAAT